MKISPAAVLSGTDRDDAHHEPVAAVMTTSTTE